MTSLPTDRSREPCCTTKYHESCRGATKGYKHRREIGGSHDRDHGCCLLRVYRRINSTEQFSVVLCSKKGLSAIAVLCMGLSCPLCMPAYRTRVSKTIARFHPTRRGTPVRELSSGLGYAFGATSDHDNSPLRSDGFGPPMLWPRRLFPAVEEGMS